jgi:hypothetical protein
MEEAVELSMAYSLAGCKGPISWIRQLGTDEIPARGRERT